jgi:hypothetical protein
MARFRRALALVRPLVPFVAAAGTLCGSLAARAMSFEFDGELVRSNGGGALAPCIKVGLAAMASARGIEQRLDTDELGHPVVTALNRSNAFFSLYFSIEDEATGTPLRVLPPGPCRTAECTDRNFINLIALDAFGTPILVRATVSTPGGRLDPSSIYAFNPQPEPPGDMPVTRVDFRVLTDDASPEASITFTVLGPAGEISLE